MTVDTIIMVSITEANRNFSKVAKLVEEKGAALILKNNTPCFLITDIRKAEEDTAVSDEDMLAISQELIAKNNKVYKKLGQ